MEEKIFDNSGAKRAQLPEDILYIIAEKMLFTKPESSSSAGFFNEINLCKKNPYTLFMNHTETNFTAFTSHFAKMKRIEFSKYNKSEKISFYKDAEHKFITSDTDFVGPYVLFKQMVDLLLERGKVRVSVIDSSYFLDKQFNLANCQNKTSMGIFCAMFLDKELDASTYPHMDLSLEHLIINEPHENIERNFEGILSLNATKIEIKGGFEQTPSIIDCTKFPNEITANRTLEIQIRSTLIRLDECSEAELMQFVDTLESYIAFIIKACPNLKTLAITFFNSFDDADKFVPNLHKLLLLVEKRILESQANGNEQLEITIWVQTDCMMYIYDTLPLGNELFQLGIEDHKKDEEETAGEEIARSIQVADPRGRKHHCNFMISKIEQTVSQSEHTAATYYGDDDYDGNYNYDDDDDYYDNDNDDYDVDNDDDY